MSDYIFYNRSGKTNDNYPTWLSFIQKKIMGHTNVVMNMVAEAMTTNATYSIKRSFNACMFSFYACRLGKQLLTTLNVVG